MQERLEQQGTSTSSVPALPPVMLCVPMLSSLTVAGRGLEIHSRDGARKEAGRNDFSSRLQPLLFLGQDLGLPHWRGGWGASSTLPTLYHKKKKPTELPRSLAALKSPFTSLLCDIPKHNKDYLKSESSLKIKTTQRENGKRVEEGDRVLPLLAPGQRQAKTAHTASCSTAHQSIAFTRQT